MLGGSPGRTGPDESSADRLLAAPVSRHLVQIHEQEFTAALGEYGDGAYLASEEVNERLERIRLLLAKHFPQPDAGRE